MTGNGNYDMNNLKQPNCFYSEANTKNTTMPLTERQQMALLLEMTAKEFQEQKSKQNKAKKTAGSSVAKKTPSKGDAVKINKRNKRGETQLHLAAIKGDLNAVKSLIKKGADVSITDHAGQSRFYPNQSLDEGYNDVQFY